MRTHTCHRTAITLIEMLVAIAISLMVLLAVISVFDQLNTSMNASKATIEQAGELRNLTQRLQADLDGMTALTLPWTPVGAGDGYFEYVEGPQFDNVGAGASPPNYWGDRDDFIMFTSRSQGKPFIGRFGANIIESDLAEIVWWVDALGDLNGNGNADPQEFVIRRRVLLIRPDLSPTGTLATFLESNDVSVRNEGGSLVANSLADLTLRENRVGHSAAFPHAVTAANLPEIPASHTDAGIDIVLDKVVAFDVRVYDALAQLKTASGTSATLAPGDVGWAAATTVIGRGAYVDLNYANNNTMSFYSGPANNVSRASTPHQLTTPTYSTWPEAYEQDGINQDGDTASGNPLIDEGRDGFDTGGNSSAADDPGETETFPPYPHAIAGQRFPALRGVQVRIRIVEPDSRTVRQATVVADFLPE